MRRLFGGAGAFGVAVGSCLLYLAAPAGAQTTGCTATFDGTDARQYNSPKRAKVVTESSRMAVTGTALDLFFSPGESRSVAYLVKLELAGASWTVTSGASTGQTWAGSVNIKDYATRGAGIYKVVAVTKSSQGTECFGRAYVKVKSGGPLSTTAGQVAAGTGLVGAAGVAASGARAGREIDEGAVKDAVGDFLEQQAGGPPPETPAAQDEAAAREEMMRKHEHELELMKFCGVMLVVAAAATIKAVASDAAHQVAAAIGGWWR